MITSEQLVYIGMKAHSVARLWPDTSPEDLRQELCLGWMESAQRAEERGVISWEDYWNRQDEPDALQKLNRSLINYANAWCRKETAAIRGNDDYQQYSRFALRQMLPALYQPEAWGSLAVHGAGGKSGKPAREGGDALASYADLTRAWDMLSTEHKFLLEIRYVDEMADWQTLVMAEYGCTEQAAAKRVSRALDALERNLAGQPLRSGPLDRRLVMSNAAAQSNLHRGYDGG